MDYYEKQKAEEFIEEQVRLMIWVLWLGLWHLNCVVGRCFGIWIRNNRPLYE